MDVFTAIKKRRSVRKYLNQKIPNDVLSDIIDNARHSPTAYNEQPWEFVVVTSDERLKEIATLATHGRFIAEASACIAVFARSAASFHLLDGCAATQTILLAAMGHDVCTCWVGGYQKDYSSAVIELLKAPPGHELISLVALGYPAEKPRVNKRTLQEVIHWENF